MIRRPPRSTLFPSRRSSDLPCQSFIPFWAVSRNERSVLRLSSGNSARSTARLRSEEHTSELQSRQYLVCRLLLEKKKKKTEKKHTTKAYAPTQETKNNTT